MFSESRLLSFKPSSGPEPTNNWGYYVTDGNYVFPFYHAQKALAAAFRIKDDDDDIQLSLRKKIYEDHPGLDSDVVVIDATEAVLSISAIKGGINDKIKSILKINFNTENLVENNFAFRTGKRILHPNHRIPRIMSKENCVREAGKMFQKSVDRIKNESLDFAFYYTEEGSCTITYWGDQSGSDDIRYFAMIEVRYDPRVSLDRLSIDVSSTQNSDESYRIMAYPGDDLVQMLIDFIEKDCPGAKLRREEANDKITLS